MLNRKEAEELRLFFKQTVVYTPMRSTLPESMERWQREGSIVIRQPVTGDETRLNRQIEAYKRWGAEHQRKGKLDTALLKLDSERTPFFDDNATSQIKKEIKSIRPKDAGVEAAATKGADLARFNARLFLSMAQNFDQQTRELADDLRACDNRTQQLLAQLRGDDPSLAADTESTVKHTIDTPESFMIENRIMAWCRLFIEDQHWLQTQPRPFWVTHSSEAVACVLDHCSHVEPRAALGPFTPATVTDQCKDLLTQYLTDVSRAPATSAPEGILKKAAGLPETASWLHVFCIERETITEHTVRSPKLPTLIKEAQNDILDGQPLIIALISPTD
jgi:hypothetical protein